MGQHQQASRASRARAVSLSEAARLLGKHRNTLARWIDEGAPAVQVARREDGIEWQLDLGALLTWHTQRAVTEERERLEQRHEEHTQRLELALAQAGDDDGQPLPRSEALRRRAVVAMKMAELDLSIRAGVLVDADVLQAFLVDLFLKVRQPLLYLSGKLAPLVAAEQDAAACHRIIDSEIRACLERIADDKIDEIAETAVEETKSSAGRSR